MSLFRVGLKAFIRNEKNEVLCVRFSHDDSIPKELQGLWDFPGGGVENGETLPQALQREIQEETGAVKFQVLFPFSTWIFPIVADRPQECIAIGYDCEYLGGEVTLSEEHDAFRWVSIEELQTLPHDASYDDPIRQYQLYRKSCQSKGTI